MKFGEKYELLESLTTGAIETFAANDKVRGERVLVHIVDCAPQKPDQSVAEWAMGSFRRLALEPAGPILETGKYSGSQYAYLITKPADEAAVKNWVRRYEMLTQETKETSARRLNPEVKAAPPVPAVTIPAEKPKESVPAGGQMTQLFQDFDSLMKSKASGPAPENKPPARAMNLSGESGLQPAPWDPSSVKPSAPPVKERMPESFSSPKPASPEFPSAASKEGPKPGEFTSFFQGPFRGDAPADVPAFSSEPIEPPRKSVGEFTAMFGQASAPPAESAPGNRASASSFTGLFKDMGKPQPTFNPPVHTPGGVIPPSIDPLPTPPSPKDPRLTPQAPIFVAPSAPVADPVVMPIPSPPVPVERPRAAKPSSLPGDGATGAFMHLSAEPAPAPVAPPSGPSPYTQIISSSKLPTAGEGEAQAAPSAAPAGGFAAPPMPKIPAPVPPPLPAIPPPPPMPKMAAPKPPAAPKLPKLDTAPPPPVSYWPLIITLTILFFLAVLLVLYFVLKH